MKKSLSYIIMIVIMCSLCLGSVAKASGYESRLVDHADLLSSSEERKLLEELDEISEAQNVDIVIVTVPSLGGKSAMAYADDFYDEHDYAADGVLLLLSMAEREWWVSTTGYGIQAITDAGLDYMAERFVPDMGNGDYAKAFHKFANLCDTFITEAKNGNVYDVGNLPKGPFPFFINFAISFGIAFIIAFIAVSSMKGKLDTVRYQSGSKAYIKQGSMQLTKQRDQFLYATLRKRPRPQQTSSGGRSGGGSHTHHSSSGRPHGGGGGRF